MRCCRLVLMVLVLGAMALGPQLAYGQGATTGNLVGSATSKDDGSTLPGAVVVAIHEPTGTRYQSVTRADGSFSIRNVRVGGPYKVSVTMHGFEPAEKGGFTVRLGEDTELQFQLSLKTFTEELIVFAEPNPIISPYHIGSTANVSQQALESLPTITRGFEDFARTSIYFSTSNENDGPTRISVAGRPNRYNNIQIDGAVNNDVFGLAAQGTPGGQAETQPVSLEAIQELQLLVSPYDVRQGGFSGGGINAITKTGSNAFHGSAFYYTRDDGFVGESAAGKEVGPFDQEQYGFSLGGPVTRDKVFFFVSGELNRKEVPSGYSVGGTGQDWGHADEAARVLNILRNQYGYDPGGLDEFIRATDSDMFFGRLDFNIAATHQLTFRHNYVDANNDIGFNSSNNYLFPDAFYQMADETNSTVLQLNSVFGDGVYNEARLTYQTIRDSRTGPTRFPSIAVEMSDGRTMTAGRERYSTANGLDQDIIEVNDDVTFGSGDHTFTLGTHNEFFTFDNLYIRDNFGYYYFDSVDDFENGWAQSFEYSFSNTDDPLQTAKFDVQQYGLYGGDQWAVLPNFTFTYGLRVDMPRFPDSPSYNQRVEDVYGFDTTEMPGTEMWSPRLGFNWDINGTGKQQLRGGTGIFSGRTPYVWMSNQYANSGIDFTRLSLFLSGDIDETNYIPFNPDPDSQPTSIGSAATNEINLADPDFEFPQVWRTSLGYDHDLGAWGLIGSAEVVYSKTEQDILYQNINLTPTGTLFDGRPVYGALDSSFSHVILVTNTDEGEQLNATLKIEKPFANGFAGSAAYMWGNAESVNDGNSSQARSNWRYLYCVDPNHPELATSDHEVEHRFLGVASYNFNITDKIGSTVALYYNHQSGRPYSTTFSRDVNGDNESNDLIYVPASAGEVIIQGGTWEDLDAYISSDAGLDDARGTIVDRNASKSPWWHTLDLHYGIDFSISKIRAEVSADVLNLMNLIDSDSGQVRYVAFNEASPVRYRGIDSATGLPIYELLFTGSSWNKYTTDDMRSRWQAKLGLRLSF